MNIGRLILVVVLGLVAAVIGLKIVTGLLAWAIGGILTWAVPVAIFVGVVYLVFRLTEKKVLGGGSNNTLP